jgi:DNA-binding IclR family transcriptional regulator
LHTNAVKTRQGEYRAVVKEGEQAQMNTRKLRLSQVLSLHASGPNKCRRAWRPWRHLRQNMREHSSECMSQYTKGERRDPRRQNRVGIIHRDHTQGFRCRWAIVWAKKRRMGEGRHGPKSVPRTEDENTGGRG